MSIFHSICNLNQALLVSTTAVIILESYEGHDAPAVATATSALELKGNTPPTAAECSHGGERN